MLPITKEEPLFFTNFIRKQNPRHWDDMVTIGNDLRKHMLENEQRWQCAYSEISINRDASNSHIDHYKRKDSHLFPELTFDYNNLFVACMNDNLGAHFKDKVLKSREDYNNLISPLTPELNAQFRYKLITGEVEGNTPNANYTKDIFNLNHPELLDRRKVTAEIAIYFKEQQLPLDQAIEFLGEFESLIRYIYTVNNN